MAKKRAEKYIRQRKIEKATRNAGNSLARELARQHLKAKITFSNTPTGWIIKVRP